MTEPEYTSWVSGEYEAFENALASCTVDEFKTHPQVRRMLSCDMGGHDAHDEAFLSLPEDTIQKLAELDAIGMFNESPVLMPCGARFVFWARKILDFAPKSIVEIGGGCGQLYATLRLLGWEGKYHILDRPNVQAFQHRYLNRVSSVFGVETWLSSRPPWDMAVSCYALGEFPEAIRQEYMDRVIRHCPKGLIVWNPVPGYAPEMKFPFPVHVEDEVPLTQAGNKVITWGRP